MRRIKNYEEMSNKELISLLKSKQSIAELFNNNLDDDDDDHDDDHDDKISDLKKIFNRLRDILCKKYRQEIKKSFMK